MSDEALRKEAGDEYIAARVAAFVKRQADYEAANKAFAPARKAYEPYKVEYEAYEKALANDADRETLKSLFIDVDRLYLEADEAYNQAFEEEYRAAFDVHE